MGDLVSKSSNNNSFDSSAYSYEVKNPDTSANNPFLNTKDKKNAKIKLELLLPYFINKASEKYKETDSDAKLILRTNQLQIFCKALAEKHDRGYTFSGQGNANVKMENNEIKGSINANTNPANFTVNTNIEITNENSLIKIKAERYEDKTIDSLEGFHSVLGKIFAGGIFSQTNNNGVNTFESKMFNPFPDNIPYMMPLEKSISCGSSEKENSMLLGALGYNNKGFHLSCGQIEVGDNYNYDYFSGLNLYQGLKGPFYNPSIDIPVSKNYHVDVSMVQSIYGNNSSMRYSAIGFDLVKNKDKNFKFENLYEKGYKGDIRAESQRYTLMFPVSKRMLLSGVYSNTSFADYPDFNYSMVYSIVQYKLNDKSSLSFSNAYGDKKFQENSLYYNYSGSNDVFYNVGFTRTVIPGTTSSGSININAQIRF